MKILKIDFLFNWTDAKSLEDDKWRLPEIDELYKMFDLGILDDGKYYWSNTRSNCDINWKKSLTLTYYEGKYPRELIGYKTGIEANVILIKKNQ
jgi:hypothetical protein